MYCCNVAIGFFTFNRLDTTKLVFESIRKVKPKKLYLISDGPRKHIEGEQSKVESVRNYIESNIDWDCDVKKNYAVSNLGCRDRMATGISWLFENEEKAIILEDDVKPADDFFQFMEDMLNKYQDNEQIMHVSGFKIVNEFPIYDSYTFSRHPMIWGWATWRRAWKKYDINIKNWYDSKKNKTLRKYFNFFGYLKIQRDFDSVYNKEKDTWDFQWAYTVLANEGLSIVPKVNLIENLGFGRADATHTTGTTCQDFTTGILSKPYSHPSSLVINDKYDFAYLKNGWGLLAMVKKAIRHLF